MKQSRRWLAWTLGLPIAYLDQLSSAIDEHYRPFEIARGNKVRTIDNPDDEMKTVQKRILHRLLRDVELPRWVTGGVSGRSAESNASIHIGSAAIAHVDIKAFFPSVTPQKVYQAWVDVGMGPKNARLLTRLTTYRGRLPQGAPTSVALANIVLRRVDEKIDRICQRHDVTPSRYVDDITVSGPNVREALPEIIAAVHAEGFAVCHRKTRITSARTRQVVTGYTVNGRSPSVARSRRDAVRLAIHRIALGSPYRRPDDPVERSILGKIAHINQTNRGAAERLAASFRRSIELARG